MQSSSSAINAGSNPGTGSGFSLTPTNQYVAVASTQTRPTVGALDIGAFEYSSGNQPPTVATAAAASASPVIG
ncbi:hypothetical protein ACMWQW_30525, partial [Escherichia coli]